MTHVGATQQIVGRERRERVSQLALPGEGCFDSRRRVNSDGRALSDLCPPTSLSAISQITRRHCLFWKGCFKASGPPTTALPGPGNAHQNLVAYSNRGKLPVGLVAFLGSEPCGVAALKADSISSHKHLTPWIGGGMVAPQFRRHGIGARLVSALEDVARNLGFTTAYAGTSTANSLLIRQGWQFMEVVQYDGEAVSIYEKPL